MSTDTYPHPYPDPEIAALVERLHKRMADLGQREDELLPALQGGALLPELHEGPPEDGDALYAVAKMLCDKGEFRHALPIALYLVGHYGEDHRHAFMAGACLQRLSHAEGALAMYGLHMMIAGPQAAAMLRAGECLESMGEMEKALRAFEEAFDLGRASNDYRKIQDMASKGIERLRAAA